MPRNSRSARRALAFDLAGGCWVRVPDHPGSPAYLRVPPLTGKLLVEEGDLVEHSGDFGNIVRHSPVAVLVPGTAGDTAAIMRFANQAGLRVAARGQGHSTFGQAQVADGIVIDMRPLDGIRVENNHAVVEAGASWSRVLRDTLSAGLTPPVLTDYLELSVGGTLSVGGISGMAHRHGAQVDNVLELEVVTGQGELRTCAPTRDPDLFAAVLAGLGQCAVIVRATLRLIPAPARVRLFKLCYEDLSTFVADQSTVVRDGRFDYVEGQVEPGEGGGWRYLLEAAVYFTPPASPDQSSLLGDLTFQRGREEVEDCSYTEFLHRLEEGVAALRETGDWYRAHPWLNLILPASTVEPYVAEVLSGLTPDEVGPGPILLYPVVRRRLRAPLFRTPAESLVFLFAILRTTPREKELTEDILARNRRLFERAEAVGGVQYPVGSIPFSREDWRRHFSSQWEALARAKDRCDPNRVLAPGQGVF